MNHDELAWQDVLFADFVVLVTEAVHSAGGLVVRARGRADVLYAMLRDGTFYESRPTTAVT
ncbi:hypothetical protein ACIPC1_17175 [Streptomyces sp. NPDC087263]|uniref:hypothetical protein n=1 Tax=Streptomyces sp. NPDC087263 TaxID=3365773 RepID=UPI00381B6BF0